MERGHKRWASAIPFLAVFLATAFVFSIGITDTHLNADDWGYTYGCRFVKDGFSFANSIAAFADPAHGAIWMPITYMTYMLDISVLGGGWMAHHAVNVVLHGLNACLLLGLLRMLLCRYDGKIAIRDLAICMAATFLWALHPMRAEAVTYVASRKEELWTLFVLFGLVGWIRRWNCFALVAFACAMMSKPTAVCALPLAYAVEVYWSGKWKCLFWRYMPLAVISIATGLLAIYSQGHPTGMESADVFQASFAWRTLNAAVSLGMYLWHTVAVSGIHADYRAVFGGQPVDCWLGLSVLAGSILLFGGFSVFARNWRLRHGVWFAVAWFLIGIAPTLGVFGYVNGDQAYADRYSYLPAMALAIGVAFVFRELQDRGVGKIVLVLAYVIAVAQVAFTWPVIVSYRDDYSVFSRVLARDSEHWRALRTVGNEYCARRGKMKEGVAMLRRSLANHDSQQTADSLAYVLAIRAERSDFDEVKRLGRVIAANPKLDTRGMMLDALAIVSMREQNFPEAVRFFQAGLAAPRRTHNSDYAVLNLGLALANIGRDKEALAVLASASRSPDKTIRVRATGAMTVIKSGCCRKDFQWR